MFGTGGIEASQHRSRQIHDEPFVPRRPSERARLRHCNGESELRTAAAPEPDAMRARIADRDAVAVRRDRRGANEGIGVAPPLEQGAPPVGAGIELEDARLRRTARDEVPLAGRASTCQPGRRDCRGNGAGTYLSRQRRQPYARRIVHPHQVLDRIFVPTDIGVEQAESGFVGGAAHRPASSPTGNTSCPAGQIRASAAIA